MKIIAVILAFALIPMPAYALDIATSWSAAKNRTSDLVYFDQTETFYCNCEMTSKNNNSGSGTVTHEACGYEPSDKYRNRMFVLEWEHVVPGALTPAKQMACYMDHGKSYCQANSAPAREILFDLHNLVPSVGQVNALRTDDRYGVLPEETSDFGACMIEDAKGTFYPAAEDRGDVARIWLYMNWKHGVFIPEEELAMFREWNDADPVSDWEILRDERIEAVQGNSNPWIQD